MLALAYQLFAVLCGWLEAILYARRGAEAFSGNEHAGMNCQRLAAWLLVPVALLAYHYLGWWVLAELVPAALLFPLFHDEAYNFTRLWITWTERLGQTYSWANLPLPADLDRSGFRAAWVHYTYGYQSDTTTARYDFNGRQRTWLAVAGCLLLVMGYWLLLKN